jgi:hypothetical protein
LWGNLKERNHWGDPDVDGKIILRWISGSGMWGMDCVELAQDGDKWQAFVNAVMSLRVP